MQQPKVKQVTILVFEHMRGAQIQTKFIKVVVIACIVDCKEGNKKAMSEMKGKLENRTVDPVLALLVPGPFLEAFRLVRT